MQQWVLHGWDGAGPDAKERRRDVRPRHLEGVRELDRTGNFVIGGAMLDEEGQMVGSTMVVQFATLEERDAWLAREPYIHEGVWERYQIYPFRVADIS